MARASLSAPAGQGLRRSLAAVHRWTGLTVGWLIVFAALTGAGLAFRPQLERAVYPDLMNVSPCLTIKSLDELITAAQVAHPRGAPLYIRTFGASGVAYKVRFGGNDTIFVDPCTARVLGEQNRYAGVFGTFEQLHTLHFMALGPALAGTDALLFAFALIAVGLYLLWALLRRGMNKALRFDRRLEGRAWNLELHRTIALYAGPILLVVALTGAPQGLQWLENAIYSVTGSAMEQPLSSATKDPRRVTIDAAFQQARRLAPNAREILAHIPDNSGDAIEMFMIAADAPHANARSHLYVDAVSGAIIAHHPYATSSPGAKIFYWAISLHTGEVGGLAGRILLFLAALTVPVLAYTGLASYLRGRHAHAVSKAAQTPLLAVRVVSVREETANVRVFELADLDGRPLPDATPGSHIDVHLGKGLVRQYSLIGGPEEASHYVIAVRRSPNSRGGSDAMHRTINPGDMLTIGGPRNHFPLIAGARHHRLVAGGIGITPLLAMARHLAAGGSAFTLDYFARSEGSTPFREALCASEFDGKVRFHHGVAIEQLAAYVRPLLGEHPSGHHLYVCGSSAFIAAIEGAAGAVAWPTENVHHEHFSADPSVWATPRSAFEITLARSGRTVEVAADKTIVEALAEHGMPTTTSCEQGVCGSCLTRVLAGVPDHRDAVLSAEQRASGELMTICVSRAAHGKLVLDL